MPESSEEHITDEQLDDVIALRRLKEVPATQWRPHHA